MYLAFDIREINLFSPSRSLYFIRPVNINYQHIIMSFSTLMAAGPPATPGMVAAAQVYNASHFFRPDQPLQLEWSIFNKVHINSCFGFFPNNIQPQCYLLPRKIILAECAKRGIEYPTVFFDNQLPPGPAFVQEPGPLPLAENFVDGAALNAALALHVAQQQEREAYELAVAAYNNEHLVCKQTFDPYPAIAVQTTGAERDLVKQNQAEHSAIQNLVMQFKIAMWALLPSSFTDQHQDRYHELLPVHIYMLAAASFGALTGSITKALDNDIAQFVKITNVTELNAWFHRLFTLKSRFPAHDIRQDAHILLLIKPFMDAHVVLERLATDYKLNYNTDETTHTLVELHNYMRTRFEVMAGHLKFTPEQGVALANRAFTKPAGKGAGKGAVGKSPVGKPPNPPPARAPSTYCIVCDEPHPPTNCALMRRILSHPNCPDEFKRLQYAREARTMTIVYDAKRRHCEPGCGTALLAEFDRKPAKKTRFHLPAPAPARRHGHSNAAAIAGGGAAGTGQSDSDADSDED